MSTRACIAIALSSLLFVAPSPQDVRVLDFAGLKSMVEGLGYTTKQLNSEPGKELIEFTIERDQLRIPINTELSGSKNYVWLKVNLGKAPTDGAKMLQLLKLNAGIQPDGFYITKSDSLMMAVPIDNRAITAEILRRVVDKLTKDVVETKDAWQSTSGEGPQARVISRS